MDGSRKGLLGIRWIFSWRIALNLARRPFMSIAEPLTALKGELVQKIVPEVIELLALALQEGTPAHKVEEGLWDLMLRAGNRGMQALFDSHGTGDRGPTLTLHNGEEVNRLTKLHMRQYVSIFGRFDLKRVAYGTRESQAIAFVPLDNRLQLPESDFSYLLQDWDQELAVEQPFAKVNQTIERMLRLKQHTDSLEGMNQQMAQDTAGFRESLPAPPPAEEGQFVVVTADCKGVVIRGQGTPTVCGGERPGSKRANQKRMAAVGAVYTIDPYVRTADEVVAALFRDANYTPPPRPQPCHKHVWAILPQGQEKANSSIDLVYDWLLSQSLLRNPKGRQPTVHLCDGQEALWQARDEYLPDKNAVDILDLLHVTPRLWQAAKLFHGERSPLVVPFVRQRVTQVLQGKVETVVRGLRRLAVEQKLNAAKRKSLARICRYLHKNRHRTRYHEYLANGYPIASGVIEGACRHLVKDRMERAGMHWTIPGAQAMLDVRSVFISGQWEAFQAYRIEREVQRLYPHRHLVAGDTFVSQEPQYSMSS